MTKTMTTLIAAALCLGAGSVVAKDYNPPAAGSACDTATKAYIGTNARFVRVEVVPEEARTPSFGRFNISGDLFDRINGDIKADPNYFGLGLEETEIDSALMQAARTNHSWAVVLPAGDGHNWTVQVFVPQHVNGRLVCRMAYPVPPTIDGSSVPAKVVG